MDNDPRADDLPDKAELSGPVRDALEQIRRQTPSAAMLARVLERAGQIAAAPQDSPATLPPNRDHPSSRRHRMFTFAFRALAAATAATALIGTWLFNQVSTTASGATAADLGLVLTKTSAAESLELKLTRDGKSGEVWVHGRKLRQNLPDGAYRIARDGKSWLVDEKANRASSQASSLFRGEAGAVDLLALLNPPLDPSGDKHKQLMKTRPVEHATRDGREVAIYRWETVGADGTLRIDAVVDAKTQLLQSIESLRVRGERTEPICKLAVIARDKPVDDELFVVGDTLTEDGRIGKLTDTQGLVGIRPVMRDRFSPVTERMPVRPGDLLQTDPRGANAASVRLVSQAEVIIGPGSTVELVSPKQLRIAAGEIKVKAEGKSPIELVGPDGKAIKVAGTQIYRADRQALVKLDKPPRWLLSYEGKVSGDSIGSLLAKIDGRDVPLTVGYHKVTVDIRDQIARTTIEESFVNHTPAQLEGTFFFPLPQDASIAGFGMWIGDKLVEADIVEKQKAREIYETILRERRDPGLLEWSGGNIFKARVFPIPAQAEKRVTITYTQVLPVRDNTYRYQYALQSELLKQHPLRQLEIDVKVNSAQPLKAVSSPTHATRNVLTAHAAHVEFSAKEYTPTQDFEAVVELQGRQSEVVLIPHRRGDDGYFMLQVTPPGTAGGVDQMQSDLLPNGGPVDLLLLADTSASMDAPSRQRQAELIAAILSALTPKDRFNLATCDVDCQWVFARPAAADAMNIEMARQKLAARRSLGWTDLDKAMQSALVQCGPKTQVVYIGDGIVTTGDADPAAFVKRLRRMCTPHAPREESSAVPLGGRSFLPERTKVREAAGNPGVSPAGESTIVPLGKRDLHAEREEYGCGTFHAVAVSSSFEPSVLKAIAAVGGGSFRQVSGSHGPAAVAGELLGEITQPALRDMKIEFRGLQTARVYPDPLPNLPQGTQQIVLGRYLPCGAGVSPANDNTSVSPADDQSCEVIVSGTLDGKPVKYSAKVVLPSPSGRGDEEGNSFIPRLWARMNLDCLLEQGGSEAIKDEIIALSEEHHIITPYTSLLVLETDADRERFGVKRRFQMRDGEKFFAAGRENANFELIQQQMKRAGAWRLGLRAQVLRQLGRMGRDVPVPQPAPVYGSAHGMMGGFGGGWMGGMGGGMGGMGGGMGKGGGYPTFSTVINGDVTSFCVNGVASDSYVLGDLSRSSVDGNQSLGVNTLEGMHERGANAVVYDPAGTPNFCPPSSGVPKPACCAKPDANASSEDESAFAPAPLQQEGQWDVDQVTDLKEIQGSSGEALTKAVDIDDDGKRGLSEKSREIEASLGFHSPLAGEPAYVLSVMPQEYVDDTTTPGYFRRQAGPGQWVDYSWFNNLFGSLPPAPIKPREPKQPWPAEARAIARSLLRVEQLTGVKTGLRIETRTEVVDPRWNELTDRSQTRAIVAPRGWLMVSMHDSSETVLSWTDAIERGRLSKAVLLGRVRASKPADLQPPLLDLGEGTMQPLDVAYAGYSVQQKSDGPNRVLLVLRQPNAPRSEVRFFVDTARHVILKTENVTAGKINSAETYEDFVEVGGAWYAGRMETVDADGRGNSTTTQKFSVLAAGQFDRVWQQEMAVRDRVQLIREPLPRLIDAKQALAAGKAAFEDQMVMLLHFQATQQWDRVLGHLAEAEKLSGKPGMRWVRMVVLPLARKAEEAKKRFLEEAEALAKAPAPQSSPGGREEAGGNELYLANYLLSHNNLGLEANEQLHLLDVLRPIYERQPAYVRATKRWSESRCTGLQQSGQSEAVLALRKQLAADYPHDYNLQQQYAQALANGGDYPAAYAWLDRVLAVAKQPPYDEAYLCINYYAEMLRQEGRYDDLVEYMGAWVKRNAALLGVYSEYLSALVYSDHLKQADELVAQWIHDGLQAAAAAPDGELPDDVDARLQAAVSQALGQGYGLNTNRIDPQWFKPLADAAIALARHPAAGTVADEIMNQDNFHQSDECRRVRKAALRMLLDEMPKLPVDQMQRLLNWISANDPAVEKEAWRKIAAGLRSRWDAAPDWQVKNRLGGILAGVLQGHIDMETWLAFLRKQLADSSEDDRAGHARQLFDALLGQPWKQVYEDEAFGLLGQLAAADQEAAQRLAIEVAAVCQMTDTLVQARFRARMQTIAHPEKLTRTELRGKQAENLRLAREGYADRLRKEVAAHNGRLAQWINVERLYLDVQTGRDLDKAAEECFETLVPLSSRSFLPERTNVRRPVEQPGVSEAAPSTLVPLGKRDLQQFERLDNLLQHRCLTTLVNLAARKGVKTGLADRVLAYLEVRDKTADTEDTHWKSLQFQLLVALDRPKDLVSRLQAWIAAGDADNGWRLILGYLEAESGQVPAAIRLFEAVRAADELHAADYRTLADWYMAVGRREAYDRARVETFKVLEEGQLNNWLYGKLRPWQNSNAEQPPPRELDVEVLFAFTALFEKSSQPQGYVYQLRQFYAVTHDFRLLAGLGDAVLGHTAGQVYPFLQDLSGVLAEVRDEAAADSILERIAAARPRAKTEVDHRALDLLEMLVERRAAEIQNQPGPHVQRALAALRRAWLRQWSAGEPRLMAGLLASLGHIAQQPLADEQVAELENIHREAKPGTIDRLKIGAALAQSYWAYSRFDRAIDLLSESLDEYQAASGGVLPASVNDDFCTLINYLQGRGQFARAEKILQQQIEHPANRQIQLGLVLQLYWLYYNAIQRDGEVSLGHGAELYRAVEKRLQADLNTTDQNYRYNLVDRLIGLYHMAHSKFPSPSGRGAGGEGVRSVADDVRHFAFNRLPEVLKHQSNNYTAMVGQTADALHAIVGARDGLAFLIRRIETEPAWFRLNNQDGWSQYADKLGQLRIEVKDLDMGELEKPLLAIVIKELRRDLQSSEQRNRVMYDKHNSNHNDYYWSEKEADFARAADEVWAEEKQSGAACQYIADYLFAGLDHYGRAIEILLDAHRRELLDDSGQSKLVEYMRLRNRFAESIPLLEPLVQRRPDNLQYRVWLMNAYFKTGKPQQLAELLQATHDYFHQDDRWDENAMAMLGRSCLENETYGKAADYLQEAIAHHQRTAPRRGSGDGVLSGYYGDQARAFAGLKKTPEAVDAAAAAVVAWGHDVDNRNNALESLRAVLRAAPDLDAYVARLDKQAAETHEENPVLRKAIGQVYRDKGQFAKAIAQLLIAAEVQPNDAETYQALIACRDRQNDPSGAVEQLLAWRQLAPRDINLYEDLGKRLDKLGQPAEAERAYTSIVEVLPAESESHQLLAEVRQRQERWAEAVNQWRQVARIRALEPTGLLGLAAALIHEHRLAEATEVVTQLKQKTWPARFDNGPLNLRGKISDLEQKLKQAGK